jgi:hypothetical protein
MTNTPPTFGRDLFTRARARGVTSEEVATLLALPVAAIRRLTSPNDLGQHTTATLRALAARLDPPWPSWLTPEPEWPPPVPPDTHPDAARVTPFSPPPSATGCTSAKSPTSCSGLSTAHEPPLAY